jgi:integrase
MKKGQNFNHPKKGSRIKVEPIRKLKDIRLIKKLLQDKPLDYAFFVVGINTNLRAGDILSLSVAQVRFVRPGESFEIKERKTGKNRQVVFNRACIEAVQPLVRKTGDWDFLFTGKRGVWTVPTVSRKVKQWCRDINLRGNYGSHTLRKTWGYHQYHTYSQSLPVLCQCFNHACQRQTLDYLCIQEKEVRDVFMNEL